MDLSNLSFLKEPVYGGEGVQGIKKQGSNEHFGVCVAVELVYNL